MIGVFVTHMSRCFFGVLLNGISFNIDLTIG